MSHFVQIKTEIREREVLTRTLGELHYRYQEGERVAVRGWQGQNQYAQVVVDGGRGDIGFRRYGEEPYEVVADWWLVEQGGIKQQSFVQQVSQRYQYNLIRDQALEQDLIFEEMAGENGEVVILLSERG